MNDDRIEQLENEVAELKQVLKESKSHWNDTYEMMKAINDKLMVPQPGHSKGLLDRMASVTIDAERGKWGVRTAIWALGALATIGGAIAFWENVGQ